MKLKLNKQNNFNYYPIIILFSMLTLTALIVAFQHYYIFEINQKERYSLFWHVPFNLFYWWCWMLFAPVIYRTATRMKSNINNISRLIIYYILSPLVIVIIHQIIASAVITIVLNYLDFQTLVYKRLLRNQWLWVDLMFYFAIVAGANVVEDLKKDRINKVKFSQLQKQLAQSQLNALKSQLRPHFLFNTLNTLSTLILKSEKNEAARMLSLLNNLLKTTVYESNKSEISLEEEMKFINHYLEIEKVRFKDKLSIVEIIPEDTANATVPSFLLQPIVENSIYHAIAVKSTPGILSIEARKENEKLVLDIEDNGPGDQKTKNRKSKEGVGLKITKERLNYIYGKDQNLFLDKSELGGLKVRIIIPFQLAAEYPSNFTIESENNLQPVNSL